MSDHPNSTPAFKSLGELTGNIVTDLKMRRLLGNTIEEMFRAECLIRTVWLALNSPDFEADDTTAVSNTLCDAWEVHKKVLEQVTAFNDAEIAAECQRRAAQ